MCSSFGLFLSTTSVRTCLFSTISAGNSQSQSGQSGFMFTGSWRSRLAHTSGVAIRHPMAVNRSSVVSGFFSITSRIENNSTGYEMHIIASGPGI